jgi:hypothetical protein
MQNKERLEDNFVITGWSRDYNGQWGIRGQVAGAIIKPSADKPEISIESKTIKQLVSQGMKLEDIADYLNNLESVIMSRDFGF